MRYLRLLAAVLLFSAASCAGGSQQAQPIVPAAQTSSPGGRQTFSLKSDSGAQASLTLRSSALLPRSALNLRMRSCPSTVEVTLLNPFRFSITIDVDSFTVLLPCTPSSPLYGATFYQTKPQPQVVEPVKLGDASASGRRLTFTSTVGSLTLPPRTLSEIVVVPETSTNEVAFPTAPGSTTDLTSSSNGLPSGLAFTYDTVSGGTTYTVACFNAFVNDTLAQALQGVPLVGIPSFYCRITPVTSAAITFGNLVTFTIGDPKPDRSIFEPDGNAQGFFCTDANQCNVPQFTVPTTYQNFIVGNVQDLRLCVPATPNVDCNGVAGDTQGGSLTSVPYGSDFQLLVADDPTYKPSESNPWDGEFHVTLSGPCALTGSPGGNGDQPPGYTDNGLTGVGPYAEFDVKTTGTGTCVITAAEDPHYITDDSDPSHPEPRSATLSIPVTEMVPSVLR